MSDKDVTLRDLIADVRIPKHLYNVMPEMPHSYHEPPGYKPPVDEKAWEERQPKTREDFLRWKDAKKVIEIAFQEPEFRGKGPGEVDAIALLQKCKELIAEASDLKPENIKVSLYGNEISFHSCFTITSEGVENDGST